MFVTQPKRKLLTLVAPHLILAIVSSSVAALTTRPKPPGPTDRDVRATLLSLVAVLMVCHQVNISLFYNKHQCLVFGKIYIIFFLQLQVLKMQDVKDPAVRPRMVAARMKRLLPTALTSKAAAYCKPSDAAQITANRLKDHILKVLTSLLLYIPQTQTRKKILVCLARLGFAKPAALQIRSL